MDDNTYKGCYIFKPATADDNDIDPRPLKKRKLSNGAGNQVDSNQDCWPRLLGGHESLVTTELRKTLFEATWAKQQAKLGSIGHAFDERLLDRVLETRADNREVSNKLQTCLLVAAPRAQLDFYKALEERLRTAEEHNDVLINLQPSHCLNLQTALKTIIRLAVTQHQDEGAYNEFLAERKALIPLNFDLDHLQRYVQLNSIDRVVVSILDVETFETAILTELISTLHSWSDRIPFMLFAGNSTTTELFESRFSRVTISLLDAYRIEMNTVRSGEDPLFALYEKIQHSSDAEIFLGPAIVNVLAELSEDQGTTPDTLPRALKYLYMTHFFAHPLSQLCVASEAHQPSWDATLYRAVRSLPSFKTHCETLGMGDKAQRQQARLLLTSDTDLQHEAEEANRSGQERMRSSLTAIRTLRHIYHAVLKLDRYTMWESESILLSSLPDLTTSAIFEAVENALRANAQALTTTQLIGSSSAGLEDLKAFCQSTTSTTDTEGAPEEPEDSILSTLGAYLTARTKPEIPSPFHAFLSESYILTSKSPLSQILHPRARTCLERALLRPADYLGCECCTTTTSPSPSTQRKPSSTRNKTTNEDGRSDKSTLPPTSLLFHMLNEAGAIVNVRDLWDAFVEVKGHGNDTIANKEVAEEEDEEEENGDADTDTETRNERSILAQFYTALAELRYLGLIRQSKRRPAVGVECIQKTMWVGL